MVSRPSSLPFPPIFQTALSPGGLTRQPGLPLAVRPTRFGSDPGKAQQVHQQNILKRGLHRLTDALRLAGIMTWRGFHYCLDVVRMGFGLGLWSLIFIPCLPKTFRQRVTNRFLSGPKHKSEVRLLKDQSLQSVIQEFHFNLKDQFKGFKGSILNLKGSKLDLKIDPKVDDIKIHSWYVPAKAGSNKPTVVLHHGRGTNLMHMEGVIQAYRQKGYGVFAYDYPGFGRSEGVASEQGVYKSGIAASLFLKNLSKAGVPVSNQVIAGNSLGSVVAINSAKALEDMNLKPKSLVSINTFPSMKETFRYNLDRAGVGKIFNVERIDLDLDGKDSFSKLKNIPVLMLHGEKDRITPRAMADKMFASLTTTGPKKIETLTDAAHCLVNKDYLQIADKVDHFLSTNQP